MATSGTRPGGQKTGGRKKGTPNKAAMTVKELCEKHGYNPVSELIRIARIAEKEYQRAEEIYDAIQSKRAQLGLIPLTNDKAPEWVKIMQKSGAEVAPYLHPKLKALEFRDKDGNNVFDETFCEMVASLVNRKNADKPK